ncbi:efflux RND transporter periplasmic adaptor subunit [candidate division KSB1 bacterium]|nr:efflux RND transporter periplasmic adaptor subunit [candidate division KSB1 bacterium]
MKRIYITLIGWFILSALVLSCAQKNTKATENETAVPVNIASISRGNVVQTLSYSGDIKAEFEVKVFSKVPDRIERFFVDAGSTVAKGAPIARIAATVIEQGAKQAEASLVAIKAQEANLRIEFERAERLYQENAMSKQQYDGVKTQYEAIAAQVEQVTAMVTSAKSQYADATITAPISGIIGQRFYEAGDMAAPTMPVVTVVQMDRVKISFNATEEDLGKLTLGQKAIVRVKSYPDVSFNGKISKISPVLDPMTRMAEIEVLVDNPKHLLKPGMFGSVEVNIGVFENVIVIPRFTTIESTTLERIKGKDEVIKNYYVFVVENNKALKKKIAVSYVNHVVIAVASGINAGEQLVISGQNNLRDSLTVSVVKKEEIPL